MRHITAYLIASLGWVVNLAYLIYEYFKYGSNFYGHLVNFSSGHILVEHILILLAIPGGMGVGYLYREQMKAKEEAKCSGELKDLFLDILRHDLLNSIGVIKNASEIVMGENPDLREGKKELNIIKRRAKNLESMVNSASRYAEIESIEKVDFGQLDIAHIIEDTVKDFKPKADEKNITFENRIEGKLVIKAAPFIEDVFYNIISNAVKYSPTGSKVTISADHPGDRQRVMVKDRGMGIEDRYKEKIFQRFQRGNKEGIRGTGLGLAIVERIMDLHMGKVWVEDNPEGGSIFVVEIPKR